MTRYEKQFYESIIRELPKISRALAGIEETLEELERKLDENILTKKQNNEKVRSNKEGI
tara:strand:- start:2838 stop:3014 length:177 start_codon:yes stop_codon:yes gene_type:complete